MNKFEFKIRVMIENTIKPIFELIINIIFCLIPIFIAILLIIGAVWGLPYYQCATKAEIQGMDYSFGIIQGCMVKQNGKWIDYNRLRVID